MRDLRSGMIEAMTELKLLLFRSKTLVTLLALTALLLSFLQPLANVVAEVHETVNPVEPFLLLVNSGDAFPSPFFYIYVFFVVLLSDLPMFEHGFRYRLVRISKRAWYIGQVVMSLSFVLIFIAFIYVVSVLPFLGKIGTSLEWSRSIVSLTKTSMAEDRGIELLLDRNILRVYAPMQAFGYSFIYFFAYLFVTILLVVVIHTRWPDIRPAGIGFLLAIYLFEYVRIYYLPYSSVKYSLAALARLGTINNGYSLYAPTMRYVNCVWAAFVGILLVILRFAARRLEEAKKTIE